MTREQKRRLDRCSIIITYQTNRLVGMSCPVTS